MMNPGLTVSKREEEQDCGEDDGVTQVYDAGAGLRTGTAKLTPDSEGTSGKIYYFESSSRY